MSLTSSFGSHDAGDYKLVLRAIRYLESQLPRQPSQDNVGQELSISPVELRKVIERWAGSCPKNYLQYLTHKQARHLPMKHLTAVDPTNQRRLSIRGRRCELTITCEKESLPKSRGGRGKGLTIYYGNFPSPFGGVLSLGTERGLCGLAFYEQVGCKKALEIMQSRWPKASFAHNPCAIKDWTEAAFEGGEISLLIMGLTEGKPSQVDRWTSLLAIPQGKTTYYDEIACKVGKPKGRQAVGKANSLNPLPWLIPCHRVLHKDPRILHAKDSEQGSFWGMDIKRTMLAWEAIRTAAS